MSCHITKLMQEITFYLKLQFQIMLKHSAFIIISINEKNIWFDINSNKQYVFVHVNNFIKIYIDASIP